MRHLSNIEHLKVGPKGVGIGIVAGGETKSLVDWDSPDWVYWSMNDFYFHFAKKLAALFEMHPPSHYNDPKQYTPGHEAWMGTARIPVYLAFPNPKIPNGIPYPLDGVVTQFGRRYFRSTVSYMIPMAIRTILRDKAEGGGLYAPRIGLWGCDMQLTSDYAKERACVEYWLGRAEQMGIEVVIPDESPLLKSDYLYGYETEKMVAHSRVIRARVRELEEQLTVALHTDRQANARVSELQGMLREAAFYNQHLTDSAPSGEEWQ